MTIVTGLILLSALHYHGCIMMMAGFALLHCSTHPDITTEAMGTEENGPVECAIHLSCLTGLSHQAYLFVNLSIGNKTLNTVKVRTL